MLAERGWSRAGARGDDERRHSGQRGCRPDQAEPADAPGILGLPARSPDLFRALPLETASGVLRVDLARDRAPPAPAGAGPAQSFHLDARAQPERREAVLLEMWEMLGRTFAEAFHLDEIADDPKRVTIDPSPEVHGGIPFARRLRDRLPPHGELGGGRAGRGPGRLLHRRRLSAA